MSAFDLCRYIEEEGMAALVPLLRNIAECGQFTLINKGPLAPMLQETVGDAVLNRNGRIYGLEIKTERNRTGNFFLETWSNKQFEPRRVGWMLTLKADIFWYYFGDADELYSINFLKLWQWAFISPSQRVEGSSRIFDFPEKQQRKIEQPNKTWGRCVPIDVIANEVGYAMYRPRKSLDLFKRAYPLVSLWAPEERQEFKE